MNFLNWFRTRPRDEVKRKEQAKAAKIASPQPVSAAATTAPATEPTEKRVAAKRVEPECEHDFRPIGGGSGNEERCQKCGHQPGLVRKRAFVDGRDVGVVAGFGADGGVELREVDADTREILATRRPGPRTLTEAGREILARWARGRR
jgi:hypothetical protein